jgi:hypothetical protein
MSVTFDLPADIESRLRELVGDLNQAAKEAAVVELYRQSRLSHNELGLALGLDRFEVEALLKKHNVTEDCITSEELLEQVAVLRQFTGK